MHHVVLVPSLASSLSFVPVLQLPPANLERFRVQIQLTREPFFTQPCRQPHWPTRLEISHILACSLLSLIVGLLDIVNLDHVLYRRHKVGE